MHRLLEILFGIKPAPWTKGGDWRVEWLAMPQHDRLLLLMLAVAVAVMGVLWLYKREGRNLSRKVRLLLGGLRMFALLGVLAMLLEPVLVFSMKEMVPSNLLVLTDRSQSMDLRDAYADQAHAARLASSLGLGVDLKELRDKPRKNLAEMAMVGGLSDKLAAAGDRNVKTLGFASQLLTDANATTQAGGATTQAAGATTQPGGDTTSTAIGAAIRQAIAAYRGQPLAGVLLITDGQSNTGEPPTKAAEFAYGEGIPVNVLAVGTPEGPRNAKLTKIDVSPVVFVRDPNQLRVLIESRGLSKAPASLVLEKSRDGAEWEEAGRQQITLEEAGQVQTVTFDFKEDRPAKLQFRARLEDVGPELSTEDNLSTADVRVIRQKIRVLFIAGATFPEVEFIRNALLRDNSLSASTWLLTADGNYDQPGNPPIKALPKTQEELDDYDCIVLYDPDPSAWPQNFGPMIGDFVGKAGGGLIYVAGERMTKALFDRQEDPSLAWLQVLPVVVEPGLYRSDVSMKLSSREPWRLDITADGKTDSIFQFTNKVEENESIIANLPGMYWHFPVTRAKPGATVLARHGDPRMRNEHGAHVLLATQLVGPGRSFFVAFDSTYRWRYLDDQFFDGFWARMIDRAGRSKQLGGRYPYTLATDRTTYRPGSPITLTARFENASERDAGIDQLHGEVEVGDAPPVPITLAPKQGENGVFETTFTADKAGMHFIRVWTGDQEMKQVVKAATLQVPVEVPNLEFERPTQDLATLQAIAKASGGEVYDLADAAKLIDAFKIKRVARVLEDRQEIWNAPLLFSLILLAIFVEWVLRKKYRLV